MPVQKIKSGRVLHPGVADYVGTAGQLFYDEELGELRISDGVTPGGRVVAAGGGQSFGNLDGGGAFSTYGGLDNYDAGGI